MPRAPVAPATGHPGNGPAFPERSRVLGRTTGAVLIGIEACLIDVEADVGAGLPTISAVGLPDLAVREGIDRVRAALGNAGFRLPEGRLVINLAPADVRKHGASLDLPIAVSILLAGGKLAGFSGGATVLAGELALDGTLRPVRGTLSIALAAREAGAACIVVPQANREEAALVSGIEVLGAATLADVAACATRAARPQPRTDPCALLDVARKQARSEDLAEVRGQPIARRALEVAAAGGHHLLLCGPPGAGKTMLARRLPGILPPLHIDEALEVTRIHSAVIGVAGLVAERPFRAPHHGVSFAGMSGGGRSIRPGEISLATHGVLYLDELPEFRRDALESLRQPLEEGRITVVRLHASATLPAEFMLVASMNPCPCGYHGEAERTCACSPAMIRRYRGRVSGPLLDRFDLRVDVPAPDARELTAGEPGETSADVGSRVARARARQRERFGRSGPCANARMTPTDLDRFAPLGVEERRLVDLAWDRLGLSARGFHKIRRVARTVADLDGSTRVRSDHIAEAMQYRPARE